MLVKIYSGNSNMDNTQERYGRPQKDKPGLISEIPIIGRREVNKPAKDMIPPHTLKFYQLVYVEKGEMEVWLDSRVYTVHEKELLVIQPYETMAYLKGVIPKGVHSFLQIDTLAVQAGNKELLQELEVYLKMPAPKVLKAGTAYSEPFIGLINEFRNREKWSKETAQSYFNILCVNLLRLYERTVKEQNIPENSSDLMSTVNSYIDDNLSKDISVSELAELTGYSENHFRVQFKKIMDMSPLKFLNMKRVDAAREMLMNDKLSVTEIAFELGFSSSQYFATFFKKQTSFTPEEFRKEAKELLSKNVKKIVNAKEAAAQMDSHFHKL